MERRIQRATEWRSSNGKLMGYKSAVTQAEHLNNIRRWGVGGENWSPVYPQRKPIETRRFRSPEEAAYDFAARILEGK